MAATTPFSELNALFARHCNAQRVCTFGIDLYCLRRKTAEIFTNRSKFLQRVAWGFLGAGLKGTDASLDSDLDFLVIKSVVFV